MLIETKMITLNYILTISSMIVILASSLSCYGEENSMTKNENKANIQSVIARIQNRDFTVQNDLSGITEIQQIADLMNSEDPEVRELALHCLSEIGGEIVEKVAVSALFDNDEQIQLLATRVLRHHLTNNVWQQLHSRYSTHPNPLVRREIAILLGKLGTAITDIEKLIENETSSVAAEGLFLAAAQNGHTIARQKIFEKLNKGNLQERKTLLEDVKFLDAKWILSGLAPLLSDQRPALRIGVDNIDGGKNLRICDITINLVAELTDTSFSFPINQNMQYSSAAINEVVLYLQKQDHQYPNEMNNKSSDLYASEYTKANFKLIQLLTSYAQSTNSDLHRQFIQIISDRSNLDSLDSQTGFHNILETLATNSTVSAREAFIALTINQAFLADDDRALALLIASQHIKSPPKTLVQFWDQHSQSDDGFTPTTIKVLLANGSIEAIKLFEDKFTDITHDDNEKFAWMNMDILQHRNDVLLLQACHRLLAGKLAESLKLYLIDVLFDYKPERWYRPAVNAYPPELAKASPSALNELHSLAIFSLNQVNLSKEQRIVVEKRLNEIDKLLHK
jgi:hypothetical protein